MNKLPYFSKGRHGGIDFSKDDSSFSNRYFIGFAFFIFIGFVVLGLRLFQLTVVKGEYYRRLSENNRIREIIIEPKRGEIIDRKGFVIAENIDSDTQEKNGYIKSKRLYKASEAIAPLIGYRQLANQQDIDSDTCRHHLVPNDKVGKKGVEKLYDCLLRGIEGKKLIEVDAGGNFLNTLSVISPTAGQKIQLALDLELQKKAFELIKDSRAAVIATIPGTGEILVLASSPSYDPNVFENVEMEKINEYFTDENKPLFNRVTEGVYPPGSVFKLVVASAALEEKEISEKTVFEDTGTIKAGPLSFGNWYFLQYGKTDGMVDIIKGLKRSNDIFFYKTGGLLGPDKTKKWANVFGYGQNTGIGFEEASGSIPSPFWKQETLNEQWYLGDTYNLSIGQGYVLVTPLQVSQATAAIANNGIVCQPQLLKNHRPECKKLPISAKTISLIQEGMKEACSVGGTGWPLFQFGISQNLSGTSLELAKTSSTNYATNSANFKQIQTACKTGTAESHEKSKIPHAWFTVYAPAKNPEIALTVLVEEAGQGSDIGGPIAKELLKTYFERSQ